MDINKIYNCDCKKGLAALPDQSIHCCVTSPPYLGQRDYGVKGQIGLEETPRQYINNLVKIFREVRRVLNKKGTLWVVIGDTYAANRTYQVHNRKGAKEHTYTKGSKIPRGCKQKDMIGIPWMLAFALRADGWYLRQDIIWEKPNIMPESVKDRCTKSHEYIFLLSKSSKYYFDSQAIKQPMMEYERVRRLKEQKKGLHSTYELSRDGKTGLVDQSKEAPSKIWMPAIG